MTEHLTEQEAKEMVEKYIVHEGDISSTQTIIDAGEIPKLKKFKVRPGKVSDSIFGGKFVYNGVEYENPPLNTPDGVPLRIMVRTERISTHDINRGSIPFKDQILAENHHYMRRLVKDIIGTSQFDVPGLQDNSVVIAAENVKTIPIEMVLRSYMAKSTTSTSLYQAYVIRGERRFSGHTLPEGLFTNGPLPYMMDTPSTKEDRDKTVDPEYFFDRGQCTPQQYRQIRNGSIEASGRAAEVLRRAGIIFVDDKKEFGINRLGLIVSQDELITMDSSRFWLTSDYRKQLELYLAGRDEELLAYIKETNPGAKEKDYLEGGRIVITPRSYSKEFARGYSEGEKGYTAEQRVAIAVRYITSIQHLLGKRFDPDMRPRDERVIKGLEEVVKLAA